MYRVKELFYTLQGEGLNSGRPAVFLRFSGCNLWSGKEEDRDKGPSCSSWCDTDFFGTNGLFGGEYETTDLVNLVRERWPSGGKPLVVCTGGEPFLQLNEVLINAFNYHGWEVAVETNGTLPLSRIGSIRPHHICVSPKAKTRVVLREGDELKVVWPQPDMDLEEMREWDFRRFYLQPMDGPDKAANTQACVAYCLGNPQWSLSLQMHKLVGLP